MKKILFAAFLILIVSSYHVYPNIIVVNVNHPKASDKGKGSLDQPFRTISRAADLAGPGDTVMVYAGIYREWVAPQRSGIRGNPIVFMAAPDEKVIVKGSEVWQNPWNALTGTQDVYQSKLDLSKLREYNPFYIPLARMEGRFSLGQIFVNGDRYTQVDSLQEVKRMTGTWMLSYDSTSIILHYKAREGSLRFPESQVEYTARERIFSPKIRGLSYIVVQGFIFEHAGNQFPSGFYNRGPKGFPQAGAVSARAGHHFTIRGNTIRHIKNIGIDCGYGGANDMPEGSRRSSRNDSLGYHLIEYNHIYDCGSGGIAGARQTESVIRYNTIEGCNYLNIGAPETGGIKVHFFYDGIIEGNIIRDNACNGIWLDNQWYGSRVTKNVVLNCEGQGIFVELGWGDILVDNNIVAYTKLGDGIYLHDASGATIAHNLLFANEHFGFYARIVSERGVRNPETGEREPANTSDIRVLNNVFIDNYRGQICMPVEDGNRVKNNQSDYNLFIGGTQWQWEGLAYNSFTLGWNDKRVPQDTLAAILKKALNDHHVPDSLQPNYHVWKNQPIVPFKWWQMATGYDQHSFSPSVHTGDVENGAIAKGAYSLSLESLFMDIKNGSTFTQLKVPRLEFVPDDFYGNPLPQGKVYPGPFQHFNDGFNRKFFKPY